MLFEEKNGIVYKVENDTRIKVGDVEEVNYLLDFQYLEEGMIVTKMIEEGHCIICYDLKITSIEEDYSIYNQPHIILFGEPISEEDEEDAEEYGYSCYLSDIFSHRTK